MFLLGLLFFSGHDVQTLPPWANRPVQDTQRKQTTPVRPSQKGTTEGKENGKTENLRQRETEIERERERNNDNHNDNDRERERAKERESQREPETESEKVREKEREQEKEGEGEGGGKAKKDSPLHEENTSHARTPSSPNAPRPLQGQGAATAPAGPRRCLGRFEARLSAAWMVRRCHWPARNKDRCPSNLGELLYGVLQEK